MRSKTQMTVTLELTQEEAEWLKAVVQNPICHDLNFDREDSLDKDMRDKFWKALHEGGVRTV